MEKNKIKERYYDGMINDLNVLRSSKQINLSEQAKYDIIHKIAWEWTEGQNTKRKYYGCKYWSEKALKDKLKERFQIGDKLNIKISRSDTVGLRHEHIVPRNLFLNYIWDSLENEKELDVDFMKANFLACVITVAEDNILNVLGMREKIPLDYKNPFGDSAESFEKIMDPWARYKIAQNKNFVEQYAQGKDPLSKIYEVEWDDACKVIIGINEFSLDK